MLVTLTGPGKAIPCGLCNKAHTLTCECCLQVHMRHGSIASLALQKHSWHITGSDGAAATAERVFLATGSHPSDSQPYPGPEVIGLDDALIPSKLKGAPCLLVP